jgi:hypothetical protein
MARSDSILFCLANLLLDRGFFSKQVERHFHKSVVHRSRHSGTPCEFSSGPPPILVAIDEKSKQILGRVGGARPARLVRSRCSFGAMWPTRKQAAFGRLGGDDRCRLSIAVRGVGRKPLSTQATSICSLPESTVSRAQIDDTCRSISTSRICLSPSDVAHCKHEAHVLATKHIRHF